MESHKPAAERIRPVLQAMEESIRAARRNRTKEPNHDEAPAPLPKPVFVAPVTPAAPPSAEPVQRLKARPKRLASPFASPFTQPAYRSQAS